MIQTQPDSTTADLEASSPLRVAIQGYAGAFHEIAAQLYFKETEIEVVAAHTFADLTAMVEKREQTDLGLMAIENTLAGSLMANYQLLLRSQLTIIGEVYLHIQQNLLTLPGVDISELTEVYSHPVAIAQCHEFFRQHPGIRLIEAVDTALSAREVAEKRLRHVGAIASTRAAELYGLQLLAPSIETNKQNLTRFWVLAPLQGYDYPKEAEKVSLSFTVDHEVGSLYKVLSVMAAYNVNLSKIQSAPIIGKPWEYQFFVDFEVLGDMNWKTAVDAIQPITHELRILGAYAPGDKINTQPQQSV